MVELVLDNDETASLAAERVPQLMAAYISFSFKKPMLELVQQYTAAGMDTRIYTDSLPGKAVLLLTWRMAAPDTGSEHEPAYLSSGLFPLMLRLMQSNDLGCLDSRVLLPE